MERIRIHEATVIRPYTILLEGFWRGNDRFKAELQGACLEILSVTYLDNKQQAELEKHLQELFPSTAPFKQKDVDFIMEKHRNLIAITIDAEDED